MSLRRILAAVSVGALAVSPLASTACRTATQIDVNVETSAGVCEAGGTPSSDKRTGIFVGAASDTGSAAESARLEGCTARLGSVTLVPSGRGGDPLVEVVMSLTKGDPAGCRSNPASCIVARRRLGFQENRRLSLTIRLDGRCIGVPCGRDQTCDDGVCRDAAVTCSGDDCGLASPPPADAGATSDAAPSDGGDATAPDAATGKCPLPGHPVAHPAFQAVTGVAGTGNYLYLAHDDGVLSVVDPAGTVSELKPAPGGTIPVTAVTAAGATVAVRRGMQVEVRVVQGGTFGQQLPLTTPIAVEAPGNLVAGTGSGLSFFVGGALGPFQATGGPVTRIASGDGVVFAVYTDGASSRVRLATSTGGQSTSGLLDAVVQIASVPGTSTAVWYDGSALWLGKENGDALDVSSLAAIPGGKMTAFAVAGGDVLWVQPGSEVGAGSPPTLTRYNLVKKDAPKPLYDLPVGAATFPGVVIAPLGRCAYVRLAGGIHAYPIPD